MKALQLFPWWLRISISLTCVWLGSVDSIPAAAALPWNQFRGPNGQGVAEDANPPVQFGSALNRIWSAEVPPGHSSPVLWENQAYLTARSGQDLETLCFDRISGRQLWVKTLTPTKIQKTHQMSNAAASTPAVDGNHVYVYFGSYGLICYDHEGREVWHKEVVAIKNKYGMATSPILYQDWVILLLDVDEGSSRLVALKQTTGETVWETPRAIFRGSWTTPMIWRTEGHDQIVALGSGRLTGYNATNGQELWWVGGFPPETINIPIAGPDLIFASSATLGGRGEPKYDVDRSWQAIQVFDKNGDGKIQREEMTKGFAIPLRLELPRDHPGYAFPNSDSDALLRQFDRDGDQAISESEWKSALADFVNLQPALVAVRSGATGDSRKSHVAWELHRHIPEIPSPLYYRDRLYLISDGGLLTCLDPATGREVFSDRVGAAGQYAASPVAAKGHLFVSSVNGVVTVLTAGDSLQVMAKNDLSEAIFATPALVANRLYVRTAHHFYAFGQ